MRVRDGGHGPCTSIVRASLFLLVLVTLQAVPALAGWNGGHDSVGSTGTSRTWYFAEGSTRAGFSEFICLLNPNGRATEATLSYMLGTGQNIEKPYSLPPNSRTTVNVSDDVPAENDVSIKISSTEGIVAERPMYFIYKGAWSGGHDVVGATAPGREWYFAEGSTRAGFETYLCLGNPGDEDSTVRVDYYCADGKTVTREGIRLARRSRLTIPVHEDGLGIGRHDNDHGDFSVKIESSARAPIVAERPMYFSYRPYLTGGHDVVGATAPAKKWYFAEGCTRDGFDTYLCLGNPGDRDAVVTVRYRCADGIVEKREGIKVARKSRFTIPVHETPLGIGRNNNAHGDFSVEIGSSNGVPIVAERPAYFSYRPFWTGGYDSVGATAPKETWYLAEGSTREGFDTYLCMQNPGDSDAAVDVTYYCADGRIEERSGIRIPEESRFTIPVHEPGPGIGRFNDSRGDFAVKVASTNGVPLIVERTMYFASRWRTIDRNGLAAARGWGEVSRGNPSKNAIAMTFDIEGSAGLTNSILDIARQKGIQCTFFVLGGFAASHPDILVRMADEGHEIANHSFSHPWFTRISDAQLASELASTEAQIGQATAFTTKPYFRFPNGDRNSALIQRVNAEGYLSVYWTIDPQEWRSSASAEGVRSVVVSQASNGAIVLMHDRSITVQALPRIIDDIRARGFVPTTLSEALSPGP